MDPIITGSLISAGTSLIGGLLGSKSKKREAERQYQQHRDRFVTLRADAEKAGFNPLTAMASGSIAPPVLDYGGGIMGNSIANAGMAIASGIGDKQALDVERARLRMDRERLDHLLEQATIRPKVGGMYAARGSTPKNPKAGTGLTLSEGFLAGKQMADQQSMLTPNELERAEISMGGSPSDVTIHERELPTGHKFHTAHPGMGQRTEDDAGEIMAAPMMLPYIVDDIANNVVGNSFDPVNRVWMQPPSKWMADQQRAVDQQKVWANDRADRKKREAAQKRREQNRAKTRRDYTSGIPNFMKVN